MYKTNKIYTYLDTERRDSGNAAEASLSTQ